MPFKQEDSMPQIPEMSMQDELHQFDRTKSLGTVSTNHLARMDYKAKVVMERTKKDEDQLRGLCAQPEGSLEFPKSSRKVYLLRNSFV
ncbi:hypothetical protein Tco_1526010 [Tanacetum coccineum]